MRAKKDIESRFTYLYGADEVEEDELDELSGYSSEQQFYKEFNWYPLLYSAAGEQFLKISEVEEREILTFLHYLDFAKRKNQLEAERIKRHSKHNH